MHVSRRSFWAIVALVGLSTHGTAFASTLVLSLDANLGVTTSGSNVTGWIDQSGSGNNASSTADPYTAVPTYVTNIGALNGNNAVRFSASSSTSAVAQALGVPFTALVNQPITVFLVGRVVGNESTAADSDYFFDGAVGTSRIALSTFSSASSTLGMFAGTSVVQSTATIGTGYHIYQAVFNGSSSQLYEDGTLVLNNANIGSHGISTSGMILGARFADGFGLNGDIANVKVYSGLMSSEEANAVGYNLQTTYALQGAYIPEPSSILLIGVGLVSMFGITRRQRRSA